EFKKFYQSDLAITLDELPEDLYKGGSATPAPATTAPATKPAETKPAVTTAAVTVSSTTAPADGDIRYGDANLDKDVTLADALLILQYVANSKKYTIEPQGIINADCFNSGDGVTAKDALSIQRLDAKVISSLPEKA
ncbi:MAG: beta-mannosidase, partial [Ruminococcus sp.]|nr:beta-mannosidase [Ruminococcus sp.]